MVVHLLETKEIIVDDKENFLFDKNSNNDDDRVIVIRKICVNNDKNKEDVIAFASFDNISKKIITHIFNEIHDYDCVIRKLKKQNEEISLKNYRLENDLQKISDHIHTLTFLKRLKYLFTKRI